MEEFYRIRRLPPYVFEQVNRAKAVARNGGADIIDLGMGNPDLPTPAHVVEKLKETVGKPRTDRYSASRGIPGLRRAQAAYYGRRFGVKLNPETQVVTTLGSKEGFANVAQAITAPGDIIVVPNPTYPIHVFGFLMAGGAIRSVPVEANDAFFGALERAVLFSIPRSIFIASWSHSPKSIRSWCCRTWPMPKSILTITRRPRCCRFRAQWMSPWNSRRCPKPIRCPAGGLALRSATNASSPRSGG
jgi:DNA-binding transcriptional MocR family regulator